MDFMGSVIGGCILLVMLMCFGYVVFNSPGIVLMGAGIITIIAIIGKSITEAVVPKDSEWRD
jgi:hypothetical protein